MAGADGVTASAIPLGDKPYDQAIISVGKEICENWYLERTGSQTAKVPYFYVRIPGLRRYSTQTTLAPCRGAITTGGLRTFFVNGPSFWELTQDGTRIARGTLNTTSGVVGMADNGSQLMLVDGADGWILDYTTNAWTRLDSTVTGREGFPAGATHVRCIDTYFLANNPRTNEYHWSDPGDGLSWPGLNVGMKIGKPDNIVALSDVANQLWVFGLSSTEVHYDTGDFSGQLWARYEGAILEVGCVAPFAVARYANNVVWLGVDKDGALGIFTNNGYQPQRLSTRGVEQILTAGRYDDAFAFTFSQNGHAFYVLQLPTADVCLVYDLTSQAWYQWTYLRRSDGTTHRWRGQFSAWNWSKNLLGDSIGDGVCWSDPTCYSNENPDGSGVSNIRAVKTLPPVYQHGSWIRFGWLQAMFQQGIGLPAPDSNGEGVDPVALIGWSDDSGTTWKNERQVRLGKQGELQTRSRCNIFSTARNRQFRVTVTDPVGPVILWGVEADMSVLPR